VAALALSVLVVSTATTAPAASVLIGVGTVPGNSTDFSGLSGNYVDSSGSTPQNRLGSFGSGISYSGTGNVYYAVNDSGIDDGSPNYLTRMHTFSIAVTPGASPGTGTVTANLLSTALLTNPAGQNYVGNPTAFTSADATQNLRLDPESIRVGKDGTIFISDEYGPNIYQFNTQGQRIGVINVPAKFQIAVPNADATTETANNFYGRVTGKGFEGLAISPDGHTLYAINQSPLIQDKGESGVNLRILKEDLTTGTTTEYLYKLANSNNVVSELLAVNDHQFLVDERDTNSGTAATTKQLFLIDTNGATDISSIGNPAASSGQQTGLPKNATPTGVTPVSKTLFLDLLDPSYGLAGASFPKNIEGLAWGPDLPSGDHLLLVTSDNNLAKNTPTFIYAFDVSPTDLPGYQPQQFNPISVPEPSSLGLAVIGGVLLLGVACYRRRVGSRGA